jgi:hypothetical protein
VVVVPEMVVAVACLCMQQRLWAQTWMTAVGQLLPLLALLPSPSPWEWRSHATGEHATI